MLLGSSAFAQSNKYAGQTLQVWSFTNELQKFIDKFKTAYPGVVVQYTIVPNEQYLAKIKPVLKSGDEAPDVFTGEAAYVKDFVEDAQWDNLAGAPYNVKTNDVYPYVAAIGTDTKGAIRGLAYQATPGAYYFNRTLAKKYLGTDDPAKVGEMISSWDKFLAVGEKVKKASDGKVFLVSSIGDLFNPFYASRKQGWVVDNKFVWDPALTPSIALAKKIFDDGLTANAGQWSPPWFNGMKKDGNVLFYMLPTWGLSYVMEANAPDGKGNWGAASGPVSYFWGGTWLGVYPGSKVKELAGEFVKFCTVNKDTLVWWAKDNGDFVSSVSAVASLKDTLKSDYLGGQKHYLYFSNEVSKINGKLITRYDQQANTFFQNAVTDYLQGKIASSDAVIAKVKSDFRNAYDDIEVK
jgi:hypothetical protein